MNILITGSNGFLGGDFLCSLDKNFFKKNKVFALIRSNKKNKLKKLKKIKFLNFDLSKKIDGLKKYNINTVIHFAAKVDHRNIKNIEFEIKKNTTIATKNLIDVLNHNCNFIFISTDKVYDPKSICTENSNLKPQTYLAKQKLICEKLIKSKFKKHFIFRLPIVHSKGNYREKTSIIDRFLYDIKKKKKVNVFTNIKRSFIETEKLNKILIHCLSSKKYGTYNLGSKLDSYYGRLLKILKLDTNSKFILKTKGNVIPIKQPLNTKKFKKFFNIDIN